MEYKIVDNNNFQMPVIEVENLVINNRLVPKLSTRNFKIINTTN